MLQSNLNWALRELGYTHFFNDDGDLCIYKGYLYRMRTPDVLVPNSKATTPISVVNALNEKKFNQFFYLPIEKLIEKYGDLVFSNDYNSKLVLHYAMNSDAGQNEKIEVFIKLPNIEAIDVVCKFSKHRLSELLELAKANEAKILIQLCGIIIYKQ